MTVMSQAAPGVVWMVIEASEPRPAGEVSETSLMLRAWAVAGGGRTADISRTVRMSARIPRIPVPPHFEEDRTLTKNDLRY